MKDNEFAGVLVKEKILNQKKIKKKPVTSQKFHKLFL